MIKLMFVQLYDKLQSKPWIGMISGIGSGAVGAAHNFFTSDTTLKVIGAISMWCGLIIALLTVSIKFLEIRKYLKP